MKLALNLSLILITIAPSVSFAVNETYLGAIEYHGGLMERGLLTLPAPVDIKRLRFEKPSTCIADLFEAGTVTEGIYDVADHLQNETYLVNDGRGMRARSVFLSVNGLATSDCAISVYNVISSAPTPSPHPHPPSNNPHNNAVTCITNLTPSYIQSELHDHNNTTPLTLAPGRTTAFIIKLDAGNQKPKVTLSFDRDPGAPYDPIDIDLDPTIQNTSRCDTASEYQFLTDIPAQKIELVRAHR